MPAQGRLATLMIDTTGFFGGTWNLSLSDVLPGLGPYDTNFAPTSATISNGSITVVPEPGTLAVLSTAGVALLIGLTWRRRRRRNW